MKFKATYCGDEMRGWIPDKEYILVLYGESEGFPDQYKVIVEGTNLSWVLAKWTALFHFFKNVTKYD
jgi:hypothetical protein